MATKRKKLLYDVECDVHRVTVKAVLLSSTADAYGENKSWFPLSEIEFNREFNDYSELLESPVVVTIPEWLINEKGWEDYV